MHQVWTVHLEFRERLEEGGPDVPYAVQAYLLRSKVDSLRGRVEVVVMLEIDLSIRVGGLLIPYVEYVFSHQSSEYFLDALP